MRDLKKEREKARLMGKRAELRERQEKTKAALKQVTIALAVQRTKRK